MPSVWILGWHSWAVLAVAFAAATTHSAQSGNALCCCLRADIFFDQFRTIYDELMVNFAMCIGVVVVICLLLLHRLNVVLLTAMLITMVDIDLVGTHMGRSQSHA